MTSENSFFIGSNDDLAVCFNPKMANRHGLIAGATGTGKTVTLQILAENFSKLGIPVFTADVKGDLAGLSQKGMLNNKIQNRIDFLNKLQNNISNYQNQAAPCLLWDLFGKSGHPVRTTISEMGPVLLSRLLDLNDTQEGVLHIAFKYADDNGLLLLDLKDLKEILKWISNNSSEIESEYGNVHSASVGKIQKNLLVLEQAGGNNFFGEPSIKFNHLMQKDFSGRGVISILDATTLLHNSKLYSTFLLWFLSSLFEELDEVGDQPLPKLVFFFDEAHLLFNDTSKALMEKIETVVRLIRSKGVSIFFVTQNPNDIPSSILSQLGNRFIHGLRAYTAQDQKAVNIASDTFRPNPKFSTREAITQLQVGEALVSLLDEKGVPAPVEKILIIPPESRLGSISETERHTILTNSPLNGIYEEVVDRESAFEILRQKVEVNIKSQSNKKTSKRQGFIEASSKSFLRSLFSTLGKALITGLLGVFLHKKTKSKSKSSSVSKISKTVANKVKNNMANQVANKITRGILGSIK